MEPPLVGSVPLRGCQPLAPGTPHSRPSQPLISLKHLFWFYNMRLNPHLLFLASPTPGTRNKKPLWVFKQIQMFYKPEITLLYTLPSRSVLWTPAPGTTHRTHEGGAGALAARLLPLLIETAGGSSPAGLGAPGPQVSTGSCGPRPVISGLRLKLALQLSPRPTS